MLLLILYKGFRREKIVFLGMTKIVILGTGNVALNLLRAFRSSKTAKVVQIVGRNKNNIPQREVLPSFTSDFKNIKEADIYIIAVSDDAISTVSQQLKKYKGIVVHTSGSKGLEVLPKNNKRGVFYPLQTFSKERTPNFSEIPICIEAENDMVLSRLEALASGLSDRVVKIKSEQRTALHLAAVFLNNFTNHLVYLADEICKNHQLSIDLLKPLLRETLEKLEDLSPLEAQTGPARRGDYKTILNHMELLKDQKQREIYSLLSQSIQVTYGTEL